MKISNILKNNKITVSLELFPPKQGMEFSSARTVVREIAQLSPSFMSVTYGAAGGTRETTVSMADEVQNVNGIPALAHLTCVSSDAEKVKIVLDKLKVLGIENVLALRGDLPDPSYSMPDGLKHASDLVTEIKKHGDFCIGGACYPEGHPESKNSIDDVEGLRRKVESGCEFLTTQMFFDNNILYSFILKLLRAGINVPVIAGIMPITKASQIERSRALSGTVFPKRFINIADHFADDPDAMKQAGIAYATEQIVDLIANGVNNIHIYTMNKPDIAKKIMENISCLIK